MSIRGSELCPKTYHTQSHSDILLYIIPLTNQSCLFIGITVHIEKGFECVCYLLPRYQETVPSNPSDCTTTRSRQPVGAVNPYNFSVHVHMPGVTPKAVSRPPPPPRFV